MFLYVREISILNRILSQILAKYYVWLIVVEELCP